MVPKSRFCRQAKNHLAEAIAVRGKCPSASEQPSEPPYGERERLVAANDTAVFLAPAAMALGIRKSRPEKIPVGFLIFT